MQSGANQREVQIVLCAVALSRANALHRIAHLYHDDGDTDPAVLVNLPRP